MIVPARYFFDLILRHWGVKVELSEVIDLCSDAYLSEQQRPAHINVTFIVYYRCMRACRCDFLDDPAKPLYRQGEVCGFTC